MGSVYAAFDRERGHRVAVKVLSQRLARHTEFRERFVAESRLAAGIPHPHILTVHAHGEDGGWHYIAMDLVETDLAALLEREGPLDVVRASTSPTRSGGRSKSPTSTAWCIATSSRRTCSSGRGASRPNPTTRSCVTSGSRSSSRRTGR